MDRLPDIIHAIAGAELVLLPEKAVFIPARQMLVIADLHLGKSMHFRKSGLAMPVNTHEKDYLILDRLLHTYRPAQLIFLGDLFHSDHNMEWERFGEWRKRYPAVEMRLAEGNHDIMHPGHYRKFDIETAGSYTVGNLFLTHVPAQHDRLYNIHGHVHPAVRLSGAGRQHIRIPCFLFGERQGVIPAFGSLTGLHALRPSKTDAIYGVVNNKILHLEGHTSETG